MFGNTEHRVPREAWLASLLLSLDQIRGFLGDHDGGSIRIATDDLRHDRGVHHPQSLEPMDPEHGIHHSQRVTSHLAGTDRVIGRHSHSTDKVGHRSVSLYFCSGVDLHTAERSEGLRVCYFAAGQANAGR